MKALSTGEQLLSLPKNTKLFHVEGARIKVYEYLMRHTHNPRYVFLYDTMTADASKFYIPQIIEGNWFVAENEFDDWSFIYDMLIQYHEHLISYYKEKKNKLVKSNSEKDDNKEIVEQFY